VLAVFVFLFITGLYLDISNPFKVNL
jgi:hypothetical protein